MHSLAALAQLEQLVTGPDGTDSEPDLLLLDYSANDWTIEMSSWAERAKATEALLRRLRSAHPHVAVILMLTAVQGMPGVAQGATSCLRPLSNYSGVKRIASYYGFPSATYLDALNCSVFTDNCQQCQPPAWFHKYKNPTTVGLMKTGSTAGFAGLHPEAKTHALIASFLDSWWRSYISQLRLGDGGVPSHADRTASLRYAAPVLPPVLQADVLLPRYSSCQPLSVHDTKAVANRDSRALTTVHRLSAEGWSLWEDRPGKPGWISNGAPGAMLTFPVPSLDGL